MCKDDIMGLIEKEIANMEHNEPEEHISSFDALPIKTKSANVAKETKSANIASKEFLETRFAQELEKEVAIYNCNIEILVWILKISPYNFGKYSWYKVTEQLPLLTLNEEKSKVVVLTTSESIDAEEQPYFEGTLPLDQSRKDARKSNSTTQSIENGLVEVEQLSVEREITSSPLEEVEFYD